MDVVALVSGGKDSILSLEVCRLLGHRVCVLGNLYPLPPPHHGEECVSGGDEKHAQQQQQIQQQEQEDGEEGGDIDSHTFQTVGHSHVAALAACLAVPLRRRGIRQGQSIQRSLDYRPAAVAAAALASSIANDSTAAVAVCSTTNSTSTTTTVIVDEVEELFALLRDIKAEFPTVRAVCSGAILSTYQRLRVENVCERLQLVSIAPLWQFTGARVLRALSCVGVEAVLIKVATVGLLPRKHLGAVVSSRPMRRLLQQLEEQFQVHAAGEGGEYETFVLRSPLMKLAASSSLSAAASGGGGAATGGGGRCLSLTSRRVVLVDDNPIAPTGFMHFTVEATPLPTQEGEEGASSASSSSSSDEDGDSDDDRHESFFGLGHSGGRRHQEQGGTSGAVQEGCRASREGWFHTCGHWRPQQTFPALLSAHPQPPAMTSSGGADGGDVQTPSSSCHYTMFSLPSMRSAFRGVVASRGGCGPNKIDTTDNNQLTLMSKDATTIDVITKVRVCVDDNLLLPPPSAAATGTGHGGEEYSSTGKKVAAAVECAVLVDQLRRLLAEVAPVAAKDVGSDVSVSGDGSEEGCWRGSFMVPFITIYAPDLTHYAALNDAYMAAVDAWVAAGWQALPGRAFIGTALPSTSSATAPPRIVLEVWIVPKPRWHMRCLRVQSVSLWAAATIGPYAQAVTLTPIPSDGTPSAEGASGSDAGDDDTSSGRLQHLIVSGRIGMAPPTLAIVRPDDLLPPSSSSSTSCIPSSATASGGNNDGLDIADECAACLWRAFAAQFCTMLANVLTSISVEGPRRAGEYALNPQTAWALLASEHGYPEGSSNPSSSAAAVSRTHITFFVTTPAHGPWVARLWRWATRGYRRGGGSEGGGDVGGGGATFSIEVAGSLPKGALVEMVTHVTMRAAH